MRRQAPITCGGRPQTCPLRSRLNLAVASSSGTAARRRSSELKDYIQDQAGLPVDEFNRVPAAGLTTISRLNEMLDNAAIAFLVMTAEDENADGTKGCPR